MLPSQRAHFDIPRHVCYLNAAAWTPLPFVTQEAGHTGVARKGQPWKIEPELAEQQHERARKAASRLINANPDDVALISSVSYGVAIAGKILTLPVGQRVLLIEDDHSSPSLEWMTRVPAQIEIVRRPVDGDWTEALLEAIARPGAPPIGLASFSSVHWSDGGIIDMPRVANALRAQGAALLIDATQAVGVVALDVTTIDPDFVIFPTYKWVLGPYGRAFIYIAKRRQGGVPLEQIAAGRRGVNSEGTPYMRDTGFVDGARRFDMGERDHLIALEMASVSMELVAKWGVAAIAERLRMLTSRLADGLQNSGALVADAKARAPHILSVGFPGGLPVGLLRHLQTEQVYVAARLGRMRISPHVYNDEQDVDQFITAFRSFAGAIALK